MEPDEITSNTFSADRPKVSVIVMSSVVPKFLSREIYSPVRLHRLERPLTFHLTSDKDSRTVPLPFPLTRPIPERYWISSYGTDGLLCVVSSQGNTTDIAAVWNPCTNRHRMVLWPQSRAWDGRLNGSIGFVGFGYDARVCDYKVVVVYYDFRICYGRCLVAFTALKSGVWKEVDDASSSHLLRT
ncbi:hypothetical protein QQ045_007547 [Rhodiola kirilowii]